MSVESSDVVTDFTVNLGGLWLLQALLDIPTLAPELRSWPYGSARHTEWLGDNPGVAVLREAGLLDAEGRVVDKIAERMHVLAAPDVEVAILLSRGGPMRFTAMDLGDPATWRAIPEDQLRIVLARRDGRWVSAIRAGEDVTIDCAVGGGVQWLSAVLVGQLDAIHPVGPSRVPAINVALEHLKEVVAERAAMSAEAPGRDAALRTLGVRGADLAELAELMDHPVAEAVLYARAYSDGQTRAGGSVLNMRDTDAGRLVVYRLAAVRGSAQDWMTFAPATAAQVEQGVRAVLASVDVPTWDTHRRM